MSHAWTHSWCKSPSRDEAVRAAEDGRPGPLPTLEEAIAQAFGFDEASVQRACDETKTWPADIQAYAKQSLSDLLEQGVPRPQALAEASRWGKRLFEARYPEMMAKSGSASSAVEHENKGERMGTTSDIQTAETRFDTAERITKALTADRFAAAVIEVDTLRTRVADLEGALESVADRAAAAETALESAPSASELPPPAAFLDALQDPIAPTSGERIRAKKLSPAASGAAGTEPVAWGVMVHRDEEILCVPFTVREAADHFVRLNGVNETMTVVPLYAAPQPAPGWLTPEEQEAIMYLIANRSQFAPQTPHEERRNSACQVCHGLLARSSPPEVKEVSDG